jgi:hypothetical protein
LNLFGVDCEVDVFVVRVITGVGVGFVYEDRVLYVSSYVEQPRPHQQQFQFYLFLFIKGQTEMVFRQTLPIKVVGCSLHKINSHIDVLDAEDVFNDELDLDFSHNTLLKVKLNLIDEQNFSVEGQFQKRTRVFVGRDGDRFRVYDPSMTFLVSPHQEHLQSIVSLPLVLFLFFWEEIRLFDYVLGRKVMSGELMFFKFGLWIFAHEKEIVRESSKVVRFYLLYVHASVEHHRFQKIWLVLGVTDTETEEMKSC